MCNSFAHEGFQVDGHHPDPMVPRAKKSVSHAMHGDSFSTGRPASRPVPLACYGSICRVQIAWQGRCDRLPTYLPPTRTKSGVTLPSSIGVRCQRLYATEVMSLHKAVQPLLENSGFRTEPMYGREYTSVPCLR